MQNKIEKEANMIEELDQAAKNSEVPAKKKKFTMVRAALVCLLVFTLICGIIYPISVTIVGQTVFPSYGHRQQR